MANGIDSQLDCTSYAHQIASMGSFIGRYYRPAVSIWPTLTRAEAQALSAVGLSIVSLWEYISGSKGRIGSLNYDAGNDEGKQGYTQASRIPQPAGTPIYYAVDDGYDPQDQSEASAIDDYFRGINDGFAQCAGSGNAPRYKVGVYGPGAICQWLKGNGRVQYTWLANAPKWPGYGYAGWNIKQGVASTLPFDHDTDECNTGDNGFWNLETPSV